VKTTADHFAVAPLEARFAHTTVDGQTDQGFAASLGVDESNDKSHDKSHDWNVGRY